MFDVSDTQRSEWNRHLHYLPTEARKKKHRSAANRRRRIAIEILRKALGSHAVHNAFFDVNFFLWRVSSATLADVMHLLEEGIVKYCFRFFLSLCLTLSWEP
jgi:hypothetical protein